MHFTNSLHLCVSVEIKLVEHKNMSVYEGVYEGAVVRALASNQCCPGSILAWIKK